MTQSTNRPDSSPGAALTAAEAQKVVLNLAVFRGDWRAHRRFILTEGGEADPRAADVAAIEALQRKDESLQIQRRILINEIRRRIGAMLVAELLDVYEHCESVSSPGARTKKG